MSTNSFTLTCIELVLESKDSALVKEIKAGADANCVVDGVPLLVHVLREGMEKSIRAMFDAKIDMAACLPWAAEVADKIDMYGDKRREAMLRALLGAPGADIAALWSSDGVTRAVCAHPKVLQWLMAQDGVDVNAMLYADEAPRQEIASLLFNSVEFFEDQPSAIEVEAVGRDDREVPEQSVRFRGAWLGAVAGLLCGRGTDLRPLCLPLVELLLRHGARPMGPASASAAPGSRDSTRSKRWATGLSSTPRSSIRARCSSACSTGSPRSPMRSMPP